jgi:exodeoxyribonuclease VII large subunit
MTRCVTHDGLGELRVRFPFDRTLVDRIKALPNRRWNAGERYWSVPEMDVVVLVDLLRHENFDFDEATRDLYGRMGGTARLGATPPVLRAAQTLPGLFDDPSPEESEIEPAQGAGDFSVSQLNEKVRRVLESAFPSSIWLVGEVSGFNKSAHRKHVGFHLVELDEDGRKVSEVGATLFERSRREIESALKRAGDPFRLEDEVTVRVRVHVELYVPWGSYRVIVEELDVQFTLGEAARRREEIIRTLTEAGLADLNPGLPLPAAPLRVGLITSLGSDAYNDVLRTLQESGFAFDIAAHGARVQGHQTEPSVLNALDWFRDRADRFDVLLICRGGGSRTDLAWFDSEPLGRAVAEFPLPVVVGIGHEQDHSVLDAVARRAKTPTAAASLLVEAVRAAIDHVEMRGREILDASAAVLEREERTGIDRARRLSVAARGLVVDQRHRLSGQRQGVVIAARTLLGRARESLIRSSTLIPGHARSRLERGTLHLAGSLRALLRGARIRLDHAGWGLRRAVETVAPASERALRREQERLADRDRRIGLIDPRRVVERGFSILRLDDGRVLTEPAAAPPGSPVEAVLRGGRLRLRSEGEKRTEFD